MAYKYGVYGVIGDDIAQNASQAGIAPVYFGTAPVNFLSDYAGKVGKPVQISNLSDAQKKLGHFTSSDKWDKYTLCEAVAAHFANTNGNVGPIYVVNVLDPANHQKTAKTSSSVTFTNKKATIKSDSIIVSTFALADKVLGEDFTISYDFEEGALVITDIGETPMTSVQASYFEIDHTKITAATIVSGINAAMKLVYQECNVIPTYTAAPGWSDTKTVYDALVAASQNINGHWNAFVFADLKVGSDCNSIEKAKTWKQTNGYTAGGSKVFWPMVKNGDNVFHISTLALAEKVRCDLEHNNVPFETCGNKAIPATALYFGKDGGTEFDKSEANELTAAGIATAVYWESNWRTWGDSTAAYTYGGGHKAREIFDVNMIMLYYIANSFQKEWGTTIDKPMTIALRDTILNREQEKLDTLVAVGALIGSPSIEFVESNNQTVDVMNGDFRWDIAATNTPPLKSATGVVSYTNSGFAAYFGGDQ